jgi:copper-containing nitrite reductase
VAGSGGYAATSTQQVASPAPHTAAVTQTQPIDVTVTASEFTLSPAPLVVAVGRTVRLTFVGKGVSLHNWTVQGLAARGVRLLSAPADLAPGFAAEMHTAIAHGIPFVAANPGERAMVEFTPLHAGTYKTVCTIPGHAQMGMVGTLVVTGQGVTALASATKADMADVRATRLPNPPVAPPVGRRSPTFVHVNLETKEVDAYLDDGVRYTVWTFNGTVPGPMIRVRVGDTVEVRLTNAPTSMMSHSIDLHAVSGPGGGSAATNVAPGQTKSFIFTALNPGVFIYHCATAPVAEHIANGMYGMIVVEPAGGLPRVDREFYLMQGEYYVQGPRTQRGARHFSMAKMMSETPDYVVFNGAVGALTGPRALQARVGQKVRIFFGNGGPDLTSSLHMIGTIFARACPTARRPLHWPIPGMRAWRMRSSSSHPRARRL